LVLAADEEVMDALGMKIFRGVDEEANDHAS
jgi:hypothetical protein